MARFRPSRLFRRFSSRSENNTQHTKDSPSPSRSSGLPSPSLPAYSVPTPRGVRKSSSLPKLRKKVPGPAEVPEVVPESVYLLPGGDEQEEGLQGRRSGSETLSGERSGGVVELEEDNKTPEISADGELRLDDEVQELRREPILIVQQPTPDVVEEVRLAAERQGSNDPSPQLESGAITLAPSTPSAEVDVNSKEELSPSPSPSANSRPSTARSVSPNSTPKKSKPTLPHDTLIRRPSIVDSANAKIVKTLLDAPSRHLGLPTSGSSGPQTGNPFSPSLMNMTEMLRRKIWVKRPGASATLVQIREDDLVDDVRDMILRKYANSLGKTFDAPDMTLSIVARQEQNDARASRQERVLGPEEEMCRTIDSYFPGGQTVEDALVINTPQRRTPKPSPRVFQQQGYHALDDYRPLENGTDYFPPMPAVIPTTIPQTTSSHDSRSSHQHHAVVAAQQQQQQLLQLQPDPQHPRSISVLNTGQIPPLPSPGAQSRRHQHRPKYTRQPTSSPTILAHPNGGVVAVNPPALVNSQGHLVHRQPTRPRLDSSASEAQHRPNGLVPPAPPLPTPPAPEAPPTNKDNSAPPTPSGGAPLGTHRPTRPKKTRKPTPETLQSRRKKDTSSSSPHPANSVLGSMMDASVPPINVLIVEDNIINLRILEGLMKRLKVRWQTAMNGQIAVDKWKAGGFHLVLMDIQMPVMTGLQATKEIRRLERVNGIGAFSEMTPEEEEGPNGETTPQTNAKGKEKEPTDHLPGLHDNLFKSPVIIVALTASSLQSDRHEALAAGCNDFLTKPVNFVWLERKVKEWGCMQALIDFDGWRLWKAYAAEAEAGKSEAERAKEREKVEREKVKMEKMAKLQEKQGRLKEERERERFLLKRGSVSGEGREVIKEEGAAGGGEVGNGEVLASMGAGGLKSGAAVLGEAML